MAGPGGLIDPAEAASLQGRHCVVALSGGSDSAAAARLTAAHAASARAVHVHHGLPASDRLAEAAHAVAEALGLTLTVVQVTLEGTSETAARSARRPALLGSLDPGEVLVTGHTLDDQAETVVQRLIRGAGPEGLAGMAVDDGTILRPLLTTRRDVVRASVADLPFVDDPENVDPRHLRTRIRSAVIPTLEAENPDIVGALGRLARHAGTWAPQPVAVRVGDGVARVALPLLAAIGPDRAIATLRVAISAARPPHPPTTDEIDRAAAVVDGTVTRAEIAGGVGVVRDRTWVRIGGPPDVDPPVSIGSLPVRWGGFAFSGADGRGRSPAMARIAEGSRVRGALTDDRIAIAAGSKRVDDALAEAGVPAELRRAWPVVERSDGVVTWIPLLRRGHGSDPVDGRYLGAYARTEDAW